MSIKNNHKLGKTIGFYGDSFCAAKYRKSPIKPGHDGHLGGNGWGGYPPDFKNYSQEQKLCFSYNVDQSLVAKPSDHEEYLNWWTHQLQKHFDKCIHYGVSGTSQEHMMYDQIDIHNERFNPNFAIPDVMICFWTFPGRIFFDHKELSMFDSDQMNFLNQIGSGTRYIGAKEKETIGITQKLMNIVKYNKLIFSTKLASNRSNALKVYFDNFCHMKLKERNPNVKIINIQIPQGDDDLNFKKQQLPLNNNLWIDNC